MAMRLLSALPTDLDPAAFLHSVVSQRGADAAFQAAAILMPYPHSRMTARFISKAAELPPPTTVEQATETIAKIGVLAAAGKIGLDEANDLVGHQKAFIEAKVGTDIEARLASIEQALRDRSIVLNHSIEVFGGLPDLPGSRAS